MQHLPLFTGTWSSLFASRCWNLEELERHSRPWPARGLGASGLPGAEAARLDPAPYPARADEDRLVAGHDSSWPDSMAATAIGGSRTF